MKLSQHLLLWGGLALVVGLIIWGVMASGTTPSSATVPGLSDRDHVRGSRSAPAVLIEYSDFQCPACAAYEPIVRELTARYGDRLVLVYRHFPLRQIHANAQRAAQAAEAADLQNGGGFWAYHDRLFDNQATWSRSANPESLFNQYAEAQGLDLEQFKKDFSSQAVKDRIEVDVRSGTAAAVPGTPTFFLNGKELTNVRSLNEFITLIDNALANRS